MLFAGTKVSVTWILAGLPPGATIFTVSFPQAGLPPAVVNTTVSGLVPQPATLLQDKAKALNAFQWQLRVPPFAACACSCHSPISAVAEFGFCPTTPPKLHQLF